MDTVFIENLEVVTTIGVYDWERPIKQLLIINLKMAWDISEAANTDDINATLDYALVAQEVERFAEQSQFQLVETFAHRLASQIQEKFQIKWLLLRVTKPGAVAAAEGVGVEIERGCR